MAYNCHCMKDFKKEKILKKRRENEMCFIFYVI